jgi:hypothetical protein
MSWPFNTTTPHVTLEDILEYLCHREGLARAQLAFPALMVATLQGGAYARLVERTEATPPLAVEQWPGSALTSHLLVGRPPRSGRPVAVTRFSVGAQPQC